MIVSGGQLLDDSLQSAAHDIANGGQLPDDGLKRIAPGGKSPEDSKKTASTMKRSTREQPFIYSKYCYITSRRKPMCRRKVTTITEDR
jgi:hypothetical protein